MKLSEIEKLLDYIPYNFFEDNVLVSIPGKSGTYELKIKKFYFDLKSKKLILVTEEING